MHLRHNDTELSSPGSLVALHFSILTSVWWIITLSSALRPPPSRRTERQRNGETLDIFSCEVADSRVTTMSQSDDSCELDIVKITINIYEINIYIIPETTQLFKTAEISEIVGLVFAKLQLCWWRPVQ